MYAMLPIGQRRTSAHKRREDVLGARRSDTDGVVPVCVDALRAASAIEVATRFGVDPRWLIDLPLKWRDFAQWGRRWHQPSRLARAQAIAVDEDAEAARSRLATPLVLEAGLTLGPNVHCIRTVPELVALGREEQHCIASHATELRTGLLHCLVLEDQDEAGRPRRSTVLIEASIGVSWEEFGLPCRPPPPCQLRAYQVREIRMRGNRASPPEHHEWAVKIAREWSACAARNRTLRASPEEMRRRVAALREREQPPIPPHRVQQYWDEVSQACIPEWLLDFNPSRGLLARLCSESEKRSGG